jgi:hypothetical protein
MAEVMIKLKNLKMKHIKVDVRSKDCLYVTIGKWVIYIDNSTGEQIIDSWEEGFLIIKKGW